jgi:hypothetical protein
MQHPAHFARLKATMRQYAPTAIRILRPVALAVLAALLIEVCLPLVLAAEARSPS